MSTHPVILLTGASRGIGLAVAKLLLNGTSTMPAVNVVTLSRSLPDTLQKLQREKEDQGGETSLLIYQGDVCSEEDNQKAIGMALDKWGRLDGVILNAGVIEFARIADVPPASFAQQMAINVSSLITTLHHALPHLRQSPTGCGKVVFVSSGASVGNTASWAAYNASKAAMNAIARTLAVEEKQIACWAIRPGVVATSMQDQIRKSGKGTMAEKDFDKFSKLHQDGQLLLPDQPGHVLAALAVQGTRKHPRNIGGSEGGAGENGAFVNWNDPVMVDFQLSKSGDAV